MASEIGYLLRVRGVLTRASAAIDRSVVRFMERRYTTALWASVAGPDEAAGGAQRRAQRRAPR
jgi:hypothetical protein